MINLHMLTRIQARSAWIYIRVCTAVCGGMYVCMYSFAQYAGIMYVCLRVSFCFYCNGSGVTELRTDLIAVGPCTYIII